MSFCEPHAKDFSVTVKNCVMAEGQKTNMASCISACLLRALLLLPGAGQAPIRQAAIQAPQVVDTTGAGDCFTAAYAVAVLEGKAGADALRFASAAASICVARKGAMPSLPSRDEVEALLRG